MTEDDKRKIRNFRRSLFAWYSKNGRDFPWRKPGRSNYEILLAEMFLQKTRAENIVDTYRDFTKKYPDFDSLRSARRSELERLIRPLGLYRNRAKSLRALARRVHEIGHLPSTREELLQLPGIGPYIANFFMVAAYGRRLPIVDTNVRRLYQRVFSFESKKDPRRDKHVWGFVAETLPKKDVKRFLLAVLDFSALVCKRTCPVCERCVLCSICDAYISESR